jgi:hypothetical protein
MRRALWEMLCDAIGSVSPQGAEADLLRVTRVFLDLPVEVTLRGKGDDLEVLADVPRWRLATVFDEPKGRLQILAVEDATP